MNKMGSKRTIIKLQPKGRPEKPETLKAALTTHNTITLTWEAGFDGGFKNTKFIVQYRHGNELSPRAVDCGEKTVCNITDLQQNSPYLLKVKAVNERGESKFTEEVVAMTKVDAQQIPIPANVHYEKSTQTASFSILYNANLKLIAMIEVENGDGTWSLFDNLDMHEESFGEVTVNNLAHNLRVRFCLELNEQLCGPYAEALVVDVRPNAATSASLTQPWVIGIIVVIVLLALMAFIAIVHCCCCKKSKTKTLKNDDLNSNRPSIIHQPPPYTSTTSGFDNKGVDTSLKDSEENLKAHLYHNNGSGYHTSTHEGPHSNSNSANGGSVNSQDSLWNVKTNNGTDIYHMQNPGNPGPQTMVVTGSNGNPGMISGNPGNGYTVYDPHGQQLFRTGFGGSEDYTHYPYPDEYLNERNRQYVADPYAPVNQKPKPEYYGDISDRPDPFHEVVDSGGQKSQHPMQHMNFDESTLAESGYSTPNSRNRRIIREIIV